MDTQSKGKRLRWKVNHLQLPRQIREYRLKLP